MMHFVTRFDYQTADKQSCFSLRLDLDWQAKITGVYGLSGSGKSTFIEILLGLKQQALVNGLFKLGDRVIFDTNTGHCLARARRGMAWVPQDSLLLPQLTVAENLALTGAGAAAAGQVVSEFGIAPLLTKKPSQLSGGEKQLVALARALVVPSRLMLLDEPFSALDVTRRRGHIGLLKNRLLSRATPAIYISHRAEEIRELCDYLLVLDEGRVKWHGPTASWQALTDN